MLPLLPSFKIAASVGDVRVIHGPRKVFVLAHAALRIGIGIVPDSLGNLPAREALYPRIR